MELLPMLGAVMGLTEEMGEREADIKSRITPMNDFMIDQNEPVLVDEDILRAVVTMNQGN